MTDLPPRTMDILRRGPIIALWVWLNLLTFAIDNQRRPHSIAEDATNKPWRPLPQRRLSSKQARRLLMFLHPVVALVSYWAGGLKWCISLVALTYWYNELGASDRNCLEKNFVNGCGYICYIFGAIDVGITGQPFTFSHKALKWIILIGFVVFSTIHMQDMEDQYGDKIQDRKTVPLVIGDINARYTIVAAVGVWSFTAPRFWGFSTFVQFAAPCILGALVVWRILCLRDVRSDKTTFKFWNVWMVSLYILPFMHRLST